jgi:light-regulated signal transduction histidine kinase (bacteriophytochrome)
MALFAPPCEGAGMDVAASFCPATSAIASRASRLRSAAIVYKEKMFNPFFTTKPAGEGTGLGLSICHDIIVKQHGGSIEVDTKPGEFTEIRVNLPRVVALLPERP